MAWLSPFRYRRPIYANTSTLTTSETDFPAALFAPDLTGKVLATFYDAVVTGADGSTILSHYWASKTAAAGIGHVKIPTLTAGHAALLVGYLYYGNSAATDQSNEAAVFSGFASRHSFDESSGSLADSSGNARTGTASGGPTYSATGKIHKGLSFDGVDDKVATQSDYIGTSACTLSAWIYPTGWGGSGFGRVLDNGKTYFYVLEPQTTVGITSNGSTGCRAITGAVSLAAWAHVAATRSATGDANVYINGVLSGSADQASGTPTAGTSAVVIGGRAADNARCFAGTIDEARVSLTVRSASWIKADYLSGSGSLLSYGAEMDVFSRSTYAPRMRRYGAVGVA